MKTKKSFKQPCPSCGAGVLIKDQKLIGKKVDCPECKFRFVAEAPKEEPEADELKDKKKKKADSKDGKASSEKSSKKKTDGDAGDSAGEKKGKKKKKAAFQLQLGSNKLQLGLVLGAVGLVVLGVAAFLIMNSGTPPAPPPPENQVVQIDTPPPEKKEEPKKIDDKQPEVKHPVAPIIIKTPEALAAVTPSFTNLLPNETEHVARVYLKNALASIIGAAAKEAYPLNDADEEFRKRVGFAITPVDAVMRAERYSAPGWSYTAVHSTERIDEAALVKALDLKEEPAIKERKYYLAKQRHPWVEQLGQLAVGPNSDRAAQPRPTDRPLYVCIFNEQTVIFADKAPIVTLLEGEGRFKYYGEGKDGFSSVPFGDTTYLTIRPDLKGMMDRMEKDAGESILFSSATAMDAARITLGKSDRVIWQFRQMWDIGQLLENSRSRIKVLGTGVFQKDHREYVMRNDINCIDDLDAQEVEKELQARSVPQLAEVLEKILGKKVKVPEAKKEVIDPTMPPMPMLPDQPPKEETKQSEIRLTRNRDAVTFELDLVLEAVDYGRLYSATALLLSGMRSELQLATRALQRDRLARGGAELGEKGLSQRQVEPGRFPPGAFKRPPSTFRNVNQPNHRVSWMAGLLPFLGHEPLYRRIEFNSSWQDSTNWLAARTLVPEFLDPSYPEESFTAPHPNLNFRPAGTHFVGIAGVGLDAASVPADDPAYIHKRGVLGYDRSASLDEVRAERGLANTILMIQVPYDGAAGVTPWIAGGGATLRGVSEKNSIEPFVLGRDRDGKPILHNDKRGTFAMMTDGSVRFIDQSISDDVFKAMCTVKGPLPPNFDLGQQVNAPVVIPSPKAAPAGKAAK